MSLLIDDNDRYPELKWDTKISKLIRDDFVLQDDHITNHITIEDTLSHRTGMPRHDMSYGGTFNGRNQTVRDLVRSLRHLPLSAELRSKYQYCNMMYVVAAYVIETVTGSWLGDVIRSRLLEPLDMKSTYFGTEEAYKAPEHFATGYYYGNGSYRKVPDMNLLQASGAGFMVSNALDYTKWIRALIDEAPPISKAGHGALRRPRTLEGGSSAPYTGPQAYALGWENGVYQGHEWFQHSGGMEAYGANVIFFPKLRYGLVAFGNTAITSNYVEMALQWNLVDEKLGVPKKDRFDWNKQHEQSVKNKEKWLSSAKQRYYPHLPVPALSLSLGLAQYTATYYHPGYRNITIELAPSSSTRLSFTRTDSTWKYHAELEHVSGDFFLGQLDMLNAPNIMFREAFPAEFRLGPDAKVTMFGALLEPAMGDEKIWFTRISASANK